jgi:hypothetical protein
MNRILMALTIVIMMFALSSCKKSEEQQTKAKQPPMPSGPIIDSKAGAPHGAEGPKTVFQVALPDEIKDRWDSVVIIIEDKKENKHTAATAKINSEFQIPDSNLTVKVGPFLPDFKMSAETITSASAEPNNPSVGIAILQDGKKIFPESGEWGWLYSKFPTIHSFQHERFGLVLKEGIKK